MTDERGGPQAIPRPERSRPGGLPAWHGAEHALVRDLDAVCDRIVGYQPIMRGGPAVARPPEEGKRSAVLVALYGGDDGATLILTRRPQHMRKHAGEIAFPGGSVDPEDDDLWSTARREAEEEVALDRSLPAYVGALDSFVTGASYSLVQPLVGRLETLPELTASPAEVDRIIHTPLTELITPGVHRIEEWWWNDEWREMHFFDLVGETVWGATAMMLANLLDVASGVAPNRAG